jgi:FixJ family two-component response regulator
MRGMSGMEFHAALTPAQADRALFLTGGALTDASRLFLKQTGVRVLIKPVDMKQMRAAVTDLLERHVPIL